MLDKVDMNNIFYMLYEHKFDEVRKILDKNPDVINNKMNDNNWMTLLHKFVILNDRFVVNFLLDNNASVFEKDYFWKTPCDYANDSIKKLLPLCE